MYSVGALVWAKSSLAREIFWPAKVVEPDSDSDNDKKKKPVIAYVNFLAENTYEAVRIASNVMPFNCERKEYFLKKGRCLRNQMKRLLFESAVKEAESCMKLHGQGKKNAENSYTLDMRTETNSPRTRRSMLSHEGKYSLRNESMLQATTTTLNKFESKSSAFSRRKITKSSLKTTSEDTSKDIAASSSTGGRQGDTDKRKVIMSKKIGGVSKAKDKISSKETNNLKPIGKTKWNRRKNKHESDPLDFDLKEAENELKDSGERHFEVAKTCSTNEAQNENNSETIKRKDDTNKPKQSRRIGLKNNIKAFWGKKRDSSNKTTSCEVQTFSNAFNSGLDSIPEERESEMGETVLTPREKRLQKRARSEFETSESFGSNTTAFRREKKKLRRNSCGDRSYETDGRASEVEKPLSTGNLELKTEKKISRQNIAKDFSEGKSLSNLNSEKTTTINRCNETKPSLKDVESCLEKLGTTSCRSNEDGLRNLENMATKENGADAEDNVVDDSSSDEDCLPEAFSPSLAPKKTFQPGDVVWAKYRRDPFWPAQVGRKDKKQNSYYYIKFFPKSDSKCIKIRKKNIVSFTDDDQEHYKSQEMDTNSREDFEEAIKQAIDILVRRALPKDEILPDEIEEPNAELSDDDDESSTCSDVEQDKLVGEPDKPVEQPANSESEVSTSDLETVRPGLTENGSQRRRKQVSRYSNILNELHRCKKRLLDIYREKVVSTRHKRFKYGTVTEKNHLQRSASFGPIQDNETQEAIIRVLKTWYDEESKTTSMTFEYVFNVWLPEAMIYYIQMTDSVSAEDAEKLFLDHAKHGDKREVKEETALLKKKTIDKATMQATVERAKQKLLYNTISL